MEDGGVSRTCLGEYVKPAVPIVINTYDYRYWEVSSNILSLFLYMETPTGLHSTCVRVRPTNGYYSIPLCYLHFHHLSSSQSPKGVTLLCFTVKPVDFQFGVDVHFLHETCSLHCLMTSPLYLVIMFSQMAVLERAPWFNKVLFTTFPRHQQFLIFFNMDTCLLLCAQLNHNFSLTASVTHDPTRSPFKKDLASLIFSETSCSLVIGRISY